MKNRHAVLALVTLALLMIPGVARADSVQYDFLTTATILVDGAFAGFADNATLSLVVDWTSVDNSGPVTTATGEIVSITASIPSNTSGFATAMLNDNTPSSLAPYFSTLGFDTTLVADAEAELNALDTTVPDAAYAITNMIAASDPFGLNPIFTSQALAGTASHQVVTPFTFEWLLRDYSFTMNAGGTGGVYAFTESVSNFYSFQDFMNPMANFTGSESVQISYELGQYLNPPTVVPEPATATLVGLGLVAFALRSVRASRLRTQ